MEPLKVISETPLPVVLVVAGIAFIFVGIGGQLGAQLSTTAIQRRSAGLIGGVLLIGGMLLYSVRFEAKASARGNEAVATSVEPLKKELADPALQPGAAGERVVRHRMRRTSTDPVHITLQTSRFALRGGSLTVTDGTQRRRANFEMVTDDSIRREVLSIEAGRPLVVKETVLSDTSEYWHDLNGQPSHERTPGVLSGHTILIERRGGDWTKSLLGAQPTNEQAAELRSPYEDGEETYPSGMVDVGATWTLDGPQIAYLLAASNILSVQGSASFTFERVAPCGEDPCAEINIKRLRSDPAYAFFVLANRDPFST